MRILVTGSRDWTDEQRIFEALLLYSGGRGTILVHGACPTGADAIADRIASDWPWEIERYPADWNKYGKRAGFIRNKEMVDLGADICLAFIKNNSKGASMTATIAERAGIRTVRFTE